METKLSQLKKAASAGDWRLALRIASKFQDLGDHKAEIKRAHEAFENGRFYEQLGKDPAQLIESGKRALIARYSLS